MSDRYYGYKTKRYGATVDGHDVEVEFDKKLLALNRVRLYVDDAQVDDTNVFYGEKELRTTLPGGEDVLVQIDSGGVGELTRAQARRTDGAWVDLEEREPRS
ncbi:hypothetical protein [Patulibacter sp.]|uniref:hypothetical protein n=1 Tax=Patulibacter sp. TaxID=1912859 RepID=UPI00271A8EE8|nr:hypothetical protein [Patulibacter sp.]MDO9409072.1 hypothetical protein [Patulibacter sp.]